MSCNDCAMHPSKGAAHAISSHTQHKFFCLGKTGTYANKTRMEGIQIFRMNPLPVTSENTARSKDE